MSDFFCNKLMSKVNPLRITVSVVKIKPCGVRVVELKFVCPCGRTHKRQMTEEEVNQIAI